MFNLQAQQYQQNFNNMIVANPNIQARSPFAFNPVPNQQRPSNNFNVLNNDAAPRKRRLVNDNNEADQANKRQHIDPTQNTHNHGIFSCFNGGCQHRTFSSESFSKLLNFFQNDQRNVLRGFCMNCGSSIFEELFHLYEHFRNFAEPSKPNNNSAIVPEPATYISVHTDPEPTVSIPNPVTDIPNPVIEEQQITIKKECNILDETDIIDHFSKTNVSDMELDESITGREVQENTPKEVTDQYIPEVTQTTDKNTLQIKKEAIQRNYEFETTVRMPVPGDFEATMRIPEDLNATIIIPYEQHEMSEEQDSDDLTSVPVFKLPGSSKTKDAKKSKHIDSNKKQPAFEDISSDPTETMCLDFIAKKIINAKNNGNDKFKNFKPNKSVHWLFEDSNETTTEKSNTVRQNEQTEDADTSFSNMVIDNLLEKIKKSSKTKKESNKFVIEVEDLHQNSTDVQKSKKVEEPKPKLSIDSYFSKADKSSNSKEAELQSNFNEQLMTQVRAEKTPQKGESTKKPRNLNKENKVQPQKKEQASNDIVAVNLEQFHPKYQTKTAQNEDNGTRNEEKTARSSKLNTSDTSKSTSLNNSSSSLNTSQKTFNTSSNALELSKHIPYTVDIDALIAKGSSNAELVSIKDLYPWIDQSISSIMFKTRSSLDILLNEYSLFSTYKCMNEYCYFFTTDFEEFKTHAKSHDSINNYCSYCLKNFDKSIDLCNHLDISHKFDRFQCNKCMFRSCQKGYVDVHQKIHHANEENCEVFKSPVQKLLKSDRSKCLSALSKNREKFVMPYRCKSKYLCVLEHSNLKKVI